MIDIKVTPNKNTDKNKNRYVARGQKDRSKFWTGIAAAMADQWG